MTLLISIHFAIAQSTCSEKLNYAQELFTSGQIEQIPELLDSCLKDEFTKQEKAQAYSLLIQTYLFDYNREKAESAMTDFLKQFPGYSPQPSDPVELVELYNTYKVKPVWSFGLIAGPTMSHILVTEHFSTENLSKLNSEYRYKIGLDAGIRIGRYFSKKIWLSLDVRYSLQDYEKKSFMSNNREELIFKERSNWITVPLQINISFGKGTLSPYIFAGGELGYLIRAEADIKRHDLYEQFPTIINKSVSVTNIREPINAWITGGVGAKIRLSKGYFDFNVGYAYCMTPYVDKSKRYSNNNVLYYYQHIDEDFKLNRYFCSVGYNMLLYKIKKKRVDNVDTNK